MTSDENNSNGIASRGQVLVIAIQLCLVIMVVRVFHIENWAFLKLCVLSLIGFLVHALLPMKLRLPFFAILSVGGIALILGIHSAFWLVGIGLLLIGICHLPAPYVIRVCLLLSAGVALACIRLDLYTAPWSTAIWPVVGSMFMFRLIVYIYDLNHEKQPVSLWWSLSYFFMLPNVCFPLFPIIDFKRFRSNYYNESASVIYQRGVHWMARGSIHLILYRVVYHYMTLSPAEVSGTFEFVRYSLAAFFLYLRVSGAFHIIVGMLLLFGFNLPETHRQYFFSSSFTDFWRRINIYWKDFMMKMVFYPMYFRLRALGPTWAMMLAIGFVFVFNWVLHAYQWFWLLGTAFVEVNDILFWTILAGLVLFSALREDRRGRQRSLAHSGRTIWSIAAQVCSTAGVFVTICMLWSMWSSASITEWLTLWQGTGLAWLGFVLFVAAAFLGSAWLTRMNELKADTAKQFVLDIWQPTLRQQALMTSLTMTVVFSIGVPNVYSRMGLQTVNVMRNLRSPDRLNHRDQVAMERGYYEKLNTVNPELRARYAQGVSNWVNMVETDGMRETKDFEWIELVPLTKMKLKGEPLAINRWGMRDKDYEKEKPSETFRMIMLGASHTFGSGVANSETFENLVEERLNQLENQTYKHYEILNMSVPGYDLLRVAHSLKTDAVDFQPDLVVSVSQVQDGRRAIQHLARVVAHEYSIPYPKLQDIVRRAKVSSEMGQSHIERRLYAYQDELIAWGYGRIAEICREQKIQAFVLLLQPVSGATAPEEADRLLQLAREAGLTAWDFTHVYDGHSEVELRISVLDIHPNAKAHSLVADHLFRIIVKQGILDAQLVGSQ